MCFNFVENDCVYKNYAFIAHVIKLVVIGSVAGRSSLGLLSSPGVRQMCLVSAAWLVIGCPLMQPADARSSIGLSRPGYGVQGGGPGGGRWGGMPYYF